MTSFLIKLAVPNPIGSSHGVLVTADVNGGNCNWLGCVVVAAPNGAPLTSGTVVLTDVEGCVLVPVRDSPIGDSLSSSVRPEAGQEGPVIE